MPTARTRRGTARRDAIVDAAAGVLLSGGVRAVSHRSAAAAAGVPLGSTTYYFADRDDLVAAAVQRAGESEAARARAALAAPHRGRGSRAVARRLVDVVVGLDRCADPAPVGALYERIVEAAREPAARAAAQAWNDAVRSVVAELLAEESLPLAPDAALAIVDGSVLGWLVDGGDTTALVDRVAAVLDALTPAG